MKSIKIIKYVMLTFFLLSGMGSRINAENKNMTENEQTILNGTVKNVKFKCKGIACTGCINTITDAIKKLNGIKDVDADVKTKIVTVTYDAEAVSSKQIEKAINDSGYKTETIK